MKNFGIGLFIILLMAFVSCQPCSNCQQKKVNGKYVLVIHGGAGTISKESMTPEMEKQYRHMLDTVIRAGEDTLKNGGSALDAVTTCIILLCLTPEKELYSMRRESTKWMLPS